MKINIDVEVISEKCLDCPKFKAHNFAIITFDDENKPVFIRDIKCENLELCKSVRAHLDDRGKGE